jgi:hypothetical protein
MSQEEPKITETSQASQSKPESPLGAKTSPSP